MNRNKHSKILLHGCYALLALLIFVILLSALGYKRDSPTVKDVTYINRMSASVDGGPWQEITLPHAFHNLVPGTSVRLRATIAPKADDGVYILSNYARAEVYLNGRIVFTFGKPQNYPSFMMNPGTEIHVVETYGTGVEMDLQIVYHSPATDSSLLLEPPMIGTSKELILERSVKFGASWILSSMQIIGGFALLAISLAILFIDRKGILFLWLGLFSITTGLWFLGTNPFAVTVFPVTAWLYLSSFIGLFVCTIPLLHFIRISVGFRNQNILHWAEIFMIGANILVLLLQLFSVYPLHQCWKFFRYAVTAVLLLLAGMILWEQIKWRNGYAKWFLIPSVILSVSALMELFRPMGYLRPFAFPFFQIGVLLFLLIMGLIAGMSVKDSISVKKQEQKLAHEKEILAIQTEEQRQNRMLLAHAEQEISRQRHDLRHHLTAIQELADNKEALHAYLANLIGQIPQARERFCENSIVNAVIAHYVSLCEKEQIKFSARLVVPETNDQAADSNLCVIFANLLENATEACGRMTEGEKFIRLNSTVKNKFLTITMDNSFNGEVTMAGNLYCSSKRKAIGIGLTSVQSIAEAANGAAEFCKDGTVFLSSVYLKLP